MELEQAIKIVLWERGNLDYKLHAGQKKIKATLEASPGKLFVGNCSRQWGKSYLMVCKAIEIANQKPKAKIKYAAAFLSDLSEFIIPAFEKILEDCPDHLRPKFKQAGTKYIFPNGSEIKLIGVDRKPDGLRGNTIDLIILDEVGFMSGLGDLYRSVLIPATTHRPNAKIIMISTPPMSPSHDFSDFVRKAKEDGAYGEFTIHDNPLLTNEAIDKIKEEYGGEESTDWKREYLCQFVVDENRSVIKTWKKEFVQEFVHDKHYSFWHKYVAFDWGMVDHTAVLFGYYNWESAKLYIEDEFTIKGKDVLTSTIVDECRKIEDRLWGKCDSNDFGNKVYKRIADNNELRTISDMSIMHQYMVQATSKETLQGMVNKLATWVKDGRVIVHPRCEMLIGCLENAIWDAASTKASNFKSFDRSKKYGHYDHLAALIYLVRNTIENHDPRPPMLGIDINTMMIPAHNQQSQIQNDTALKKMFGIQRT